jgi:hypothetical protein
MTTGMWVDLPYPPTPEHAPMFAALARESAWEISRVDLDDTSSSLPRVDAILEQMRLAGVAPEAVSATLFAFGCYAPPEPLAEALEVRRAGCSKEPTRARCPFRHAFFCF